MKEQTNPKGVEIDQFKKEQTVDVKTARAFIKSININPANLEYIAKSGEINGSLLIDLEKAFESYASQQVEAYKKRLEEKLTYRREQESYEGGDWFAGFCEAIEIIQEENK